MPTSSDISHDSGSWTELNKVFMFNYSVRTADYKCAHYNKLHYYTHVYIFDNRLCSSWHFLGPPDTNTYNIETEFKH